MRHRWTVTAVLIALSYLSSFQFGDSSLCCCPRTFVVKRGAAVKQLLLTGHRAPRCRPSLGSSRRCWGRGSRERCLAGTRPKLLFWYFRYLVFTVCLLSQPVPGTSLHSLPGTERVHGPSPHPHSTREAGHTWQQTPRNRALSWMKKRGERGGEGRSKGHGQCN